MVTKHECLPTDSLRTVVNTQDKLESRRSELLREDNLFSFAFHKPRKESIKF